MVNEAVNDGMVWFVVAEVRTSVCESVCDGKLILFNERGRELRNNAYWRDG